MKSKAIPISEKYSLTIQEAAEYSHIGESKLRRLVEEHKGAGWVIWNGSRILIKRKAFERFLDATDTI